MPRELDEDDVRVRPPRSTRPRTKSRPGHLGAAVGLVVTVDRGRYRVRVDDTVVTAVRARELGRRAVVVGDAVSIVGDTGGGPDAPTWPTGSGATRTPSSASASPASTPSPRPSASPGCG